MALLVVMSVTVTSMIIGLVLSIYFKSKYIYGLDYQVIESEGGMVRIVEVIEVDGRKYVSLEDYQKLMEEYEKTQRQYTNAEILADVGEDEVYT